MTFSLIVISFILFVFASVFIIVFTDAIVRLWWHFKREVITPLREAFGW